MSFPTRRKSLHVHPSIALALPYSEIMKLGAINFDHPAKNFFGVKASLPVWPDGWMMTDKGGWLQWWGQYCGGRRLPVDDTAQVARWHSFGRRHMCGLVRACLRDGKTINASNHWLKSKQAMLHWGIFVHNPDIVMAFAGDILDEHLVAGELREFLSLT